MKDNTTPQKNNRIPLLLKWSGKNKYYIYLAVFLALISGIAVAVPYYGIYKLIEIIFDADTSSGFYIRQEVFFYGALIFVSILIRYLPYWGSIIASHKGAYTTLYNVRCMVIEHIGNIPLGQLSKRNTGEIKIVLTDHIEKLELFLAHHLTEFVYYFSGPVAVFIYLCTVSPKLAIASLIPLVMAFTVIIIMFSSQNKVLAPIIKAMGGLNSSIIEYINGMKLIKAYDLGARSFKKYSDAVERHKVLWDKVSKKMGPPYAAYAIIIECGLIFMLPLGGFMVLRGDMATGSFLLFLFAGSMYLTEIKPLQELGSNFAEVLGAVDKVKELLEIEPYKGGLEFPKDCSIEFKDVNFAYNTDIPVLKDINIKISSGEKIAIVGPSGAGKSTLIELAARSYDVNEGIVKIGGIDIKTIEYENILLNTAIIYQKTFLSGDTVLENIKMGTEATMEQIHEAAKQAQIHDFIMSLPNGYETEVGSYGTRFSGGEKQRIAIARAILKNAPILILDEATSASDPENQLEIDKAINNLCQGKTALIVAHRLDIVSNCDKVLVIEDGSITAFGTHDELLTQSSYYKKVWIEYHASRSIKYQNKKVDMR